MSVYSKWKPQNPLTEVSLTYQSKLKALKQSLSNLKPNKMLTITSQTS